MSFYREGLFSRVEENQSIFVHEDEMIFTREDEMIFTREDEMIFAREDQSIFVGEVLYERVYALWRRDVVTYSLEFS